MKSFGTPGQQVEKRYCPGQNGTSGHFTLNRIHILTLCCLMVLTSTKKTLKYT